MSGVTRAADSAPTLQGLACLAVAFQTADLITGAWMMSTRGAVAEINPLARAAFGWGGVPALVALKAALALAATMAVQDARRERRPRLAQTVLVTAAGAGLFGWWSNLA